MAFRAQPHNLVSAQDRTEKGQEEGAGRVVEGEEEDRGAQAERKLYRAPRLAPVPFPAHRTKRQVAPMAVQSDVDRLSRADAPYVASATGLSNLVAQQPNADGRGGLSSSRARQLAEMQAHEEENFIRLSMNKSEARRRARDEETLAMGGAVSMEKSRGRKGAEAGLAAEFADVLSAIDRREDAYDSVRAIERKNVLDRARSSKRAGERGASLAEAGPVKKSRFEKQFKRHQRKNV